jgi:hypothetical protein
MDSGARWGLALRDLVRDSTAYEGYHQSLLAIAYLGIKSRKELLKISRCQRSISINGRMRSITKTAKSHYSCPQDSCRYRSPLDHTYFKYYTSDLLDRFGTTTRDTVKVLSEACNKDPAMSAVISNLCRSAPFLNITDSEAEQNRIDSWEKEISACLGLNRPPCLDYSVWFSDRHQDIYRPLSINLPSAPFHNSRIREAFHEWKISLRGDTFFPQLQVAKSLSRVTAQLYQEKVHGYGRVYTDVNVSSAMLERWYAKTGEEIGGPCEIRQIWGYNDTTPRSYFAQGGRTFHGSKLIRPVLNSLANSFPETHFISRYSVNDLKIGTATMSFIYDYTSFTSNMTEFKYFIEELANFCDDVEIRIVDSHQGILNWTLGELLREYNATCNIQGEFTINRYMEGLFKTFRHKIAGFLGVYGNIVGCTTVHGLHACQLCGDRGACKCVGDDVFGTAVLGEGFGHDDLISGIQELGEVHREKVCFWPYRQVEEEGDDDTAYPYCKRPFDRFENRMLLEQALFLPIFGLLYPISDNVHDSMEDLYTRIKILASQTYSLIRQCRSLYPPLEDHQRKLLEEYLKIIYASMGVPLDGRLPFETFEVKGLRISHLFMPAVTYGFLDKNPWDLVQQRYEIRSEIFVEIPRSTRDRIVEFERVITEWGNPVETCMDRRLVYLEKMEWLISEPIYEVRYMTFPEYTSFYDSMFAGDLSRLYTVRVVEGSPVWIKDLVNV